MIKSIICAGQGGQGVLTAGKLLMHAQQTRGYMLHGSLPMEMKCAVEMQAERHYQR